MNRQSAMERKLHMSRAAVIAAMLSLAVLAAGAQHVGAQQAGVPQAGDRQTELVVSAAASLTDVLTSLAPSAQKAVGAKLLFNFGGSGALRQQIESGAPADLFFSAAVEDVDKLEKAGLVDKATRVDLLSNAIVMVGDEKLKKPTSLEQLKALLSSASLVAVGNPDAVPAGRYAIQALKTLGLYDIVEKKLVLGGNVRQVLQYVESGSAPVGFVFATDALTLKPDGPAKRLYEIPQSAIPTPVVYPIVVVSSSTHKAEASKLVAFLQTKEATDAFIKAGFVVLGRK